MRAVPALLVAGMMLVVGACRGKERRPAARDAQIADAAPGAPRPAGAGVVEGTVTLVGTPPEMLPLVRKSDPFCASTEAREPFVRVGAGGELADVVVRLPLGAAPPPAAPPPPLAIAQRACTYTPYVATAAVGQVLTISNLDRTAHNVAAAAGGESVLNKAQPEGSPPIERKITEAPGTVITLGCDIHPWMRGHVVVVDHGYAAVTDERGHFQLDGVPAGEYDLEAWHPHLGEMRTRITVTDKRVTRANLTLQASSFERP